MSRSRLIPLFALPALFSCADAPGGATGPEHTAEPAPLYLAKQGGLSGQYIIVMKEDHEPDEVIAAARVKTLRVYDGVLSGFAARLSTSQVEAIRRLEGVEFVEQDQIAHTMVTRNIPATWAWGLDRIDQKTRGLSGTYTYTRTGAGVNVYVLDTGIEYTHPEFAGPGGSRAVPLYDAFGGNGADCHGHGTHVAGTIGGVSTGVASGVNLFGLRVLDCTGNGSYSGIIAALDWLRVNRVRPAVANMSLGGGYSKALNVATDRLNGNGVFVVVAAGNDAAYSCDVSPASAIGAFTVGAVDSTDARASFSNWGRCVSAYAPGVGIASAYLNGQYAYMSGTSMAAPHVAGVAAQYYEANPTVTLAVMRNRFLDFHTTPSVVRLNDPGNIMYGTPNKLLYTNGL